MIQNRKDGRTIMKYRNCFGKLEPSIGLYFVQKSSGGKYKICKKEGWYTTDAMLLYGSFLFSIDPFDSMVKACAYMKTNLDRLI
jgi:hypothetical protein